LDSEDKCVYALSATICSHSGKALVFSKRYNGVSKKQLKLFVAPCQSV